MNKIRVYHFHNGSGGGVLSVIRNLLLYRQDTEIENHVIYTINKEQTPYYEEPSLEGAASEHVFYYSPKWNFYYTCRQLAKLLPNQNAVIVAHDWLELGMVSQIGLQNHVIFFVHGDYDYYYHLALKHIRSINLFICVSASIEKTLRRMIKTDTVNVKYARFPVPQAIEGSSRSNTLLNIIFIGRCEHAKGYNLLIDIEYKLRASGLKVTWHIVGEKSDDLHNQAIWPIESDVIFYGLLSPNNLNQLLLKVDFLVLPSYAEGMPVSIIEAMKAGVIPIVNNLPGGIQELIINGRTGYKIDQNLPCRFASIIKKLHEDKGLVNYLSEQCSLFANRLFNPIINAAAIEDIMIQSLVKKTTKQPLKVYGSRLDSKYIPNFITTLIRNISIR